MKTEYTDQAQRPLQEELNNRKTDFEKKAPEDKKKIYAEGLQALAESDLLKNALQVDDIAVNFTLLKCNREKHHII